MHNVHGDVHEIGLQDNCSACEEHAKKPWLNLDTRMLESLIRRNFFWRFGENYWVDEDGERVPRDRNAYAPRSENEAIAMANITNVMECLGRMMEVDEDSLIQSYLKRNWHIDF